VLARRQRRIDPRRAMHFAQQARRLQEQFERPLAAWALPELELPTLSARELQIAELVAGGVSRDEVAERLVVSRRTVDSHLQRIYAKLGASGRADLREWLDRSR
jgi:DNA-binding NarL/FixJ family response regulator